MVSQRLTRYAWLSILAALVTMGLKLVAWRLTGSVGLLSDALESLVNLAAAVLALLSLWVASRPPDDDHAFGHTKVEYFASGMEGALIMLAAAGIGWSALDRLWHPEPLASVGLGLSISAVASLVNLVVARVLMRAGREAHSVVLQADAHHLMTDVWTSVAVVIGVALVAGTGWLWLDPALGLALAGHIVWIGIRLVRESMLGLMDTGLPAEEMAAIHDVLAQYESQGVQHHALLTRQAGAWRFMSVHVLVPGEWTVTRGHELVEQLEKAIRSRVPRLTVLTHLEPLEDPASWEDVQLDRGLP
ncbi:MAG: cation diffusion facilitator family transporter [Roseimicrobium sp.]